MKQICSKEHFNRLLKKFEKITLRVIEDHEKIKSSNYFFYDVYGGDSEFKLILNKLFSNYKSNPFKTKSSLTAHRGYKYYVSYTFEDEFGKRSNQPKYIIFRVFVKYNYRKKRIVRWTIPVNWEYLN